MSHILPKSASGADSSVTAPSQAQLLLQKLLKSSIVLTEDLEALSHSQRNSLTEQDYQENLLAALTELKLITDYQAGRIDAGTLFGLVLGNYRILNRLGAGGMGVVFKAEHIQMRKQVAIKVLPTSDEFDPRILRRFRTEIRAIAQLNHPNIVGAIEMGQETSPDGNVLHYFVMEYVPGQDMEELVHATGPMAPPHACDLIHQIASALSEAHKHHLVHRDLKPSNIQVTPEGQAKLLDFGLARNFSTGLTEQGVVLGTIDFMAPEQAQDSRNVDIRSDIYGLGGVLYWCLTGSVPFPKKQGMVKDLANRLFQQPPAVREVRSELPVELEIVIQKMMALHPDDRYATPEEVMKALLPFLKMSMREHMPANSPSTVLEPGAAKKHGATICSEQRIYHVLLVDDDPTIRSFCQFLLQDEGIVCDEAENGEDALQMAVTKSYDIVLLDFELGGMSGQEVCKILREQLSTSNLKIIMVSGSGNADTLAKMLLHGADDFITKPFSVGQLKLKIKALIKLKEAQDRAEFLQHQLVAVNHQLEQSLTARHCDLVEARNALVLALAKMVEHRANAKGSYLKRLQKYVRALGEEASRSHGLAEQLDENYIELAVCCAPLHDIGKVGLPDYILMKPGKLDGDERVIMQAHTTIGAETLHEVAKNHPAATAFLEMAVGIARHHHERFDGTGYPDGLTGADIPLAARLVAICDVYDALRSRRVYKPSLSHNAAIEVMRDGAGTQFDPALLHAFMQCGTHFDSIFRDNPD
jgi:response regulator RpfG family c-di-GMP phosphodiesterase/tRNA A-37 threonylcarbamoyl transferase component Bud32